MKIVHIINSLPRSGAEMALFRLAVAQQAAGDHVHVISLLNEGVLRQEREAEGIRVTALNFRLGASLPRQVLALVRAIREAKPELVHTWLYHANLIGGTASRIASLRTPVVWGIHHSYLKAESSKRTTRLVSRALAAMSRLVPTTIVYCAQASRVAHEAAGYRQSRGTVIPNGVDTSEFAPDADARADLRAEFGIPADAVAVGSVSRWHPDKDVPTLVAAGGKAMDASDRIWLLLVGGNLDPSNADLAKVIDATGQGDRIKAIGPRQDIPRILNALDIFALSSITEAFPVSIIEAMASRLPVVSTEVGDAREMIDRSGRVVPVRDRDAMASAILDLSELEPRLRTVIADAARTRVIESYRLEVIVERHRQLYRSLIGRS